jgi:hypothetical protein
MYAAFSVHISSFAVVSMLASSRLMPQIMPVEHYAKATPQ